MREGASGAGAPAIAIGCGANAGAKSGAPGRSHMSELLIEETL